MRRVVGVTALLAGAVLTAAGSSRPLYETTRIDSGYRSAYRVTLWASEYTTPDGVTATEDAKVLFGVPVVVAAALLVLTAVLVLASARLPARVALAARVGSVAAAGLLVGAVWSVGQNVLASTETSDLVGGKLVATAGSGMWLLVVAAVVAVAGCLLVQRRPEEPVYQLPDDDDTDTPPMGIPIHPSVSTEESSPG
ncbi:hypothetical protein ACFFQW_34685 [Umezawaea endophytica]|uniref:Membrane protein (TIGR02234 family) n=1 Tax=Umezawaea endophytica TaxID=1654476 RepID=A0A9X2VSL9_9PSEU|nr:hypothetical protein [Umezawaea endophytica]MCS7481894.1 hypothetical protein [Umezawaea endophytica]